MNLKHLGDAFDHWKCSVLKLIHSRNLRVVPMFTDDKQWTRKQLHMYAKLLGVNREDVLQTETRFSNRSRGTYFDIPGPNDVFLDPDIGIGTSKKPKKEHVTSQDVAVLLSNSRSRMLMIYQSKWLGRDMAYTLERVLSIEGLRQFHHFGYGAGQVGMVFISHDQKRIARALERIRHWVPGASIDPLGSGRDITLVVRCGAHF